MENNQVRDKSAKRWILACAAGLLIAAGLGVCAALGGLSVGQTVYMIRPVVTATYSDDGKPARDDEVLYGMSGAIVGEEDANGFRPVLTQYRYRVLLHRDDYMLRTAVPDLWQGDPSHLIAGSRADVLAKPDVKAFPPLMTLPRGAFVRVSDKDMDSDADYREILLHDGRTGYIRSHHLRPVRVWSASGEDANRRQVVQDALSYLGVQYRWGGKSPEGIDCSGLASMAYLLNGLAIFRNSRPSAGFPVALLHMPMLPGGGYDRQ